MLTALGGSAAWSAGDPGSTTVALWRLNEPAGARVAVDASGHGNNGTVGSSVVTGEAFRNGTGYRFPYTRPQAPPPRPERLVVVPDSAMLDPGRADYTVTLRYRTTHGFGNIVQKGQARTPGGNWKIQAPHGIVQCQFRGSEGRVTVGSRRALDDGDWHTVRCQRTAHRVVMTVDGTVVMTRLGTTGSIANGKPLTIGGKRDCDQVTVGCDYFVGMIDFVRVQRG